MKFSRILITISLISLVFFGCSKVTPELNLALTKKDSGPDYGGALPLPPSIRGGAGTFNATDGSVMEGEGLEGGTEYVGNDGSILNL